MNDLAAGVESAGARSLIALDAYGHELRPYWRCSWIARCLVRLDARLAERIPDSRPREWVRGERFYGF